MNKHEVMASGILAGISGIFARMAMRDIEIEIFSFSGIIFNPLMWLSAGFGLLGFIYLQRSLYEFNVSFVGPVASSIAITTSVILAVAILYETVSIIRWIGVAFIIIGVMGMGKIESLNNLNPRSPRKRLGGLLGR